MLLDLKVQHWTAIVFEGCKDKVRIIVNNRAVWRRVKEMRSSLFSREVMQRILVNLYKLKLIFVGFLSCMLESEIMYSFT